MEFKNILIIAVVIIIIYLLYLWLFKDTTNKYIVQTTLKGNSGQTVLANTLPNGGTSLNYSYTFWIYINDYNQNYGEKKIILDRHSDLPGSSQDAVSTSSQHTPLIYLGANKNDLMVHISDTTQGKNKTTLVEDNDPKVEDIPLQKWCFIAVSLDSRVLDIYLDGKLVTSHYYDNLLKAPKQNDKIDINQSSSADIKTNGSNSDISKSGWAGILSNVEYFDRSLNAREVYERYRSGFTGAGGILGGLGEDVSKFNMKVSFLQDDKEVSQFKI
tara:strand:- start:939 stop:1754 length:816 start_codon:yes stop_codon:yes gene_type:complete